jgi:hypothetical protein
VRSEEKVSGEQWSCPDFVDTGSGSAGLPFERGGPRVPVLLTSHSSLRTLE